MSEEQPAGALDDAASAPTPQTIAEADALRLRLVEHLRESGALHEAAVERAMRSVLRHVFLPASSLAEAYADAAVATHWENGIAVSSASQPAIVALMLEQLDVAPGMRVLEIGAGTGYNAALLAALVGPGGSVTSVDIDPVIVAEARAHLAAADAANVMVHVGDGRDGWPEGAPYDRILLTVGADDVWPSWREQLVEGGLLVLPLELANGQASIAFRRHSDLLTSESITPCGFMRLRGGDATGPSLVSLADGRRLAADRAAEIAEPLTALLRTRPRIVLGRRLDAGTLQRLGFAVALRRDDATVSAVSEPDQAVSARLVTLLPRNFNGRGRHLRYGVYASGADGPSLALYGSFLPFLFVFGGDAAERVIAAAITDDARSYLPIERWRIEARPRSETTIPTPPGAVRLTRVHCTLDLWPSGDGRAPA